jgi:hypothetical protein
MENIIKINVKEIWCEKMDWINVAQDTTSGRVL